MRLNSTHPHLRSQGNVLLLTVFTVVAIGIVVFSCLELVSSQNVSIARGQAWNGCIPAIEAGIEEAMAHLNNPLDTNLLSDGWTLSNGTYMQQRRLGDDCYHVNITFTNTLQPVIVCTGSVPIPLVALPVAAGAGFPSDAELQSQYLSRTVRVVARRTQKFVKAMVAREQINMNGNTITTDSFDSSDRNYSTPTGQYDPTKIKDNGDVSTLSGLVDSLSIGNADIKGRLNTGPGGSSKVGSGGAVGSLAWHAAGKNGIEPGWESHDMNMTFQSVNRPWPLNGASAPASGPPYVLDSGNYEMSSLNLSSSDKMIIQGKVILVIDGDLIIGGTTAGISINKDASLELYVAGPNTVLNGAGINNKGWATNLIYYGLASNQQLNMKGNGEFTGSIYAPDTTLKLIGGGTSDQDFAGACVVKSINVNGHYKFHYDEALGKYGPPSIFVITSWTEL